MPASIPYAWFGLVSHYWHLKAALRLLLGLELDQVNLPSPVPSYSDEEEKIEEGTGRWRACMKSSLLLSNLPSIFSLHITVDMLVQILESIETPRLYHIHLTFLTYWATTKIHKTIQSHEQQSQLWANLWNL